MWSGLRSQGASMSLDGWFSNKPAVCKDPRDTRDLKRRGSPDGLTADYFRKHPCR